MNTYAINIVAPILRDSNKLVAYNQFPIICVTKKSIDEILTTNKNLQNSIKNTIMDIGLELLDDTFLNIRVITEELSVENTTISLNKYYEKWN